MRTSLLVGWSRLSGKMGLILRLCAGAASAVAAVVLFAIGLSDNGLGQMVFPPGTHSRDFQVVLGTEGAFLFGMLLCEYVEKEGGRTWARCVAVVALIACVGCLVSPLFAAFSPLVAFLCRISCPISLYYPQPRSFTPRRSGGTRVSPEELVSFVAMVLLVGSMMCETVSLLISLRLPHLALWLFAMFAAIGMLFYLAMAMRAAAPAPARKALAVAYHGMELWFWLMFVVDALLCLAA